MPTPGPVSGSQARTQPVMSVRNSSLRGRAMPITLHNPAGVAAPFSRYSHGASAPAGARWLHISGQVGATPDGTVPDDPERQMELAWDNLLAVLADAGMAVADLVKVDGFITRPDLVP